jgi:hypothetical protein
MKEQVACTMLVTEVTMFIESDHPMDPELNEIGWFRAFAHYLNKVADAKELEQE